MNFNSKIFFFHMYNPLMSSVLENIPLKQEKKLVYEFGVDNAYMRQVRNRWGKKFA